MCGRYYVDEETRKAVEAAAGKGSWPAGLKCGDVFPSQLAAVLAPGAGGHPMMIRQMYWGFKRQDRNGLLINARAETALERPAFRDSMRYRRCVIPAAGFYEWNREREKAVFTREDKGVLYLAGCYTQSGDGQQYVILTTEANSSVLPVHQRMPVILESGELERWLLDERFADAVLHRIPPLLAREQEYEQQRLPF